MKLPPYLTLIKTIPGPSELSEQQDDGTTHLLQCWTRARERLALIRLADQIASASRNEGIEG